MSAYVPELGQAAFGQSWQAVELGWELESALSVFAELWDLYRVTPNPFCNTSERYDGTNFTAHAYSWDDEEDQQFNFAWRDLRISWYKHSGRGASANRAAKINEVREMVKECSAEIITGAA